MFILNNSFLVFDGYKLFNHDESERARVCQNLSVSTLNQKENLRVFADMNVTINQKRIYVTTVVNGKQWTLRQFVEICVVKK